MIVKTPGSQMGSPAAADMDHPKSKRGCHCGRHLSQKYSTANRISGEFCGGRSIRMGEWYTRANGRTRARDGQLWQRGCSPKEEKKTVQIVATRRAFFAKIAQCDLSILWFSETHGRGDGTAKVAVGRPIRGLLPFWPSGLSQWRHQSAHLGVAPDCQAWWLFHVSLRNTVWPNSVSGSSNALFRKLIPIRALPLPDRACALPAAVVGV